jgi:hypothetical protein
MKTTNLQNAIMLSSILGTLLSHYDVKNPKENKKPIQVLRSRLKKFLFKRNRSNPKLYKEAILLANDIWSAAFEYFKDDKTPIELVSTIIRLYDVYEEELSKFANIHNKQIEQFALSNNVTRDCELNSYKVADYLIDKLSVHTDKKRRVLNLLTKVNNESKNPQTQPNYKCA